MIHVDLSGSGGHLSSLTIDRPISFNLTKSSRSELSDRSIPQPQYFFMPCLRRAIRIYPPLAGTSNLAVMIWRRKSDVPTRQCYSWTVVFVSPSVSAPFSRDAQTPPSVPQSPCFSNINLPTRRMLQRCPQHNARYIRG